jgi:hypothetical protein
MDRIVARRGDIKNAYACNVLDGKPERKGPPGRTKIRWEDNIKMNLKYCVRVWTGYIWLRRGYVTLVGYFTCSKRVI